MDTKPIEIQSESRIQSELIKHGFLVNKPNFDKEGADLLLLSSIKKKDVHLLKIQCKGRTIKNTGSYIDIPVSYVTENFVVFLYVIDENLNDILFIFFHDDIIADWEKLDNKYILRFTHKKLKEPYFLEREFNKEMACKLKSRLEQQKIKKYTSLIIDGLFLESSIQKTIQSYKEIYPDRQLNYPSLQDVITGILSTYDYFKSNDKIINCYVCYYTEDEENLGLIKSKITTSEGVECTIYIEKTNNLICFEIIEYLERVVNSENIIFVANDIAYQDTLNKIKKEEIDVILVTSRKNEGRMFTEHKWGNITYPLATSIGLKRHEW